MKQPGVIFFFFSTESCWNYWYLSSERDTKVLWTTRKRNRGYDFKRFISSEAKITSGKDVTFASYTCSFFFLFSNQLYYCNCYDVMTTSMLFWHKTQLSIYSLVLECMSLVSQNFDMTNVHRNSGTFIEKKYILDPVILVLLEWFAKSVGS